MVLRIQKLLQDLQLSPSAFADSIGVQRSSLSHILSGRNRPSLDFVIKVIQKYPEVDLYWLITGTEATTSKAPKASPQTTPDQLKTSPSKGTIDRIVVLNADGTFQTYDKSE